MTPTFSSAGRPAGNLSSTTHCRNSSQKTGQLSSTPHWSRRIARSRSVVAGVMRSTMELGRRRWRGSMRRARDRTSSARPATAFSVTWPLPGMLSQDITVKGAMPAARRRFSPATIRPKAVFGASACLASCDDVGMGGIEMLGRRRDVIAALGDGQRDDADRGLGERGEDCAATSKGLTKSIIAPVTCARARIRPPARRRSSASPAPRASRASRRPGRARRRRRSPSRDRAPALNRSSR